MYGWVTGGCMTLKEWFNDKPRGSKAAMANSIGISRTWMALLISKSRLPSAELCNSIDLYTNGEVARVNLRPDLFGELDRA
jgi:DNA-binding transcriptional regulator YdaS (Cro superfamily)